MNNDLNKVLAELAAKLGVTSEHLYGALLRQAYLAGVWDLVSSLLMLAAIWAGVLIWFRKKGELNAPVYADIPVIAAVVILAIMFSGIVFDGLY